MEQVRPLPTGIQSFEVLRTDGYMYVDKTALIYRLVSTIFSEEHRALCYAPC